MTEIILPCLAFNFSVEKRKRTEKERKSKVTENLVADENLWMKGQAWRLMKKIKKRKRRNINIISILKYANK